MVHNVSSEAIYQDIREAILELINLIEIDIDVSYVLEEVEEIRFKIRKLNVKDETVAEEINQVFNNLYDKYKNKMSAPLSSRDKRELIENLKEWLIKAGSMF